MTLHCGTWAKCHKFGFLKFLRSIFWGNLRDITKIIEKRSLYPWTNFYGRFLHFTKYFSRSILQSLYCFMKNIQQSVLFMVPKMLLSFLLSVEENLFYPLLNAWSQSHGCISQNHDLLFLTGNSNHFVVGASVMTRFKRLFMAFKFRSQSSSKWQILYEPICGSMLF